MANIVGGDILNEVRLFLAEPSSGGRYPDMELYSYIDLAQTQCMLDVEWPEATLTTTSDGLSGGPGTEFILPEIQAVLRVYINGQPIVPTTIPLLEGDQLGVYDQSTTTYQPQWNNQPFTGFPSANASSFPDNPAMPFYSGQRPRYYQRGGTIGFVPPPTSGWKIAIDVYPGIIPVANAVNPAMAVTFWPQIFKEMLSWRTCMYAYFAGGTALSDASLQVAQQGYESAKKSVLAWKAGLTRSLPKAPVVLAHRVYQRGPYRGPQSGYRFGN